MARLASLICVVLLAAVGCRATPRQDANDAAPPDRPSLAVPLGGGPMSVAGALNVLATARCHREELCGRVGVGKAYRDRTSCERTALQAHAHDVGILQCKGGIDGKRLETCATKLRAMACEREDVAAAEMCGRAKLCLKE